MLRLLFFFFAAGVCVVVLAHVHLVFQDYQHNLQMLTLHLLFTAGEFGIVYRARLIRSTIRRTDCEIVAVKTVKGKDKIQP